MIDQPSSNHPEQWKHHWRYCPETNIEVVYENPLIRIWYCHDCPLRTAQTKLIGMTKWPFIKLSLWYINRHIKRAFDDKVLWCEADKF